jgi:hypothetical protein
MHYGGGGGVSSREQRSRARSRRGGVSENWIAGSAAASLFFLTAIATRPFKFHENSVAYTSSSFVSSIHSLGLNILMNSATRMDSTWSCWEWRSQDLPGAAESGTRRSSVHALACTVAGWPNFRPNNSEIAIKKCKESYREETFSFPKFLSFLKNSPERK